jgi:hypothetical protein
MKVLPLLFVAILLSFTNLFSQSLQLDWANGYAGGAIAEGHNILTDATGNVYIKGHAGSGTFDADPSASGTVPFTNAGIVLAKHDADGNYLWAFSLGTSASSGINLHSGMCFDTDGNIIIVGSLAAGKIDFDPSADSLIFTTSNGMLFVAKYTPAGSLLWANAIPADKNFTAGLRGVDVDANGNIFIGGFVNVSSVMFDFDLSSSGGEATTAAAGVTFFMAKYDASGNYQWLNILEGKTGSQSNRLTHLATDGEGNFYITGEISGGRDFDPSADSLILNGVTRNIFIAKYSYSGSLVWAGMTEGNASFSRGIATDVSNNVYISGDYSGTVDFDFSATNVSYGTLSNDEIFIAKYSSAGNLEWVNALEASSGDNSSRALHADKKGYLYTTGYIEGATDFDPSSASAQYAPTNTRAIYAAKYDESGNFVWVIVFGASTVSWGLDIASDASGNALVTGAYRNNTDFHPSGTGFVLTGNSLNTMFAAKYAPCSSTSENVAICEGDTLYASTLKLISEGSYPVSFASSSGCDSVVVFNLTVNLLPNAQLSVNNNIISVSQTADTYQWINCDTELPIQNEESQTFTATASGNYAVDITTNNCTIRSDCENITVVGINSETNVNAIAIYPNPSNGVLVLKSNAEDYIVVYDIFGKDIASFHLNSDGNFSKTIQLNAGVYFVHSTITNKILRAVVVE